MQKYAFVDRDGTIVWEPAPDQSDPRLTYTLKNPDDLKFMDGAIEGLKTLVENGYKLVLATNQTHLGTPSYPRELFDEAMKLMHHELDKHGIHFEFEMVCPHGPDDGCDCRKPRIGGLKEFLATHDVDFANSLMFGDRATDGEFAKNLGVRFVHIETNKRFELPKDI